MNLKDKAFLEKFPIKESSILIGVGNFGATLFPITSWLDWYPPGQSKNDQIFTQSISIRSGRFPVQTQLDAWPGLGTQPCYEGPGDFQIKIVRKCSD